MSTEQEAYTHSIVVSNLPQDVQEEELWEYFERRREHGGGPVTDMRLNTQKGEAIVNFTDYKGKEDKPYLYTLILRGLEIKWLLKKVNKNFMIELRAIFNSLLVKFPDNSYY